MASNLHLFTPQALATVLLSLVLLPLVHAESDPMQPEIAAAVAVTTSHSKQDPTQPPPHHYRLSAIRFDGSDYRAVIDGITLHQGDTIGSATIQTINRNGVTLVEEERTLHLKLNHIKIKQSRPTPAKRAETDD
ncbi:MAG: hypothetical protein HQL48_06605 [Gammaproteobacteria bacterium]|nr:hypothetical protein [Gammaproteobacteria bacterium]